MQAKALELQKVQEKHTKTQLDLQELESKYQQVRGGPRNPGTSLLQPTRLYLLPELRWNPGILAPTSTLL